MYEGVSTSAHTYGGGTDDVPITIGLHQESTINPYIFTLILYVLVKHIQEL